MNNNTHPIGMSALFEAMNNAQYAEQSLDDSVNTVLGLTESVSYLDASDMGLVPEDEVEHDMVDSDFDFASDSEKDLFDKIDNLLDRENDDIDELDSTLESFIAENEQNENLYECNY